VSGLPQPRTPTMNLELGIGDEANKVGLSAALSGSVQLITTS
jgi:hypothetical protein